MSVVSGCDYIYVLGLRFKSGECVVEVTIDGQRKKLALVRDGKGRSRTERWLDKPRSDGATGEINLRDLILACEKSRETRIKLWVGEGLLHVAPDAHISMGREGREATAELVSIYSSMDRSTAKTVALAQIRNASYGKESAEDTRKRVLVSLSILAPEDLAELGSQAGAAVSALSEADILRGLLGDVGIRTKRYSKNTVFEREPEGRNLDSATERDVKDLHMAFDAVTGYENGSAAPTHLMFREVLGLYERGEIDRSLCSNVEAVKHALELLRKAERGDIISHTEFANLDDRTLMALLAIDKAMFKAAKSMSDSSIKDVLSAGVSPQATESAWHEIVARDLIGDLSYDALLASHAVTSGYGYSTSPVSDSIRDALTLREIAMSSTSDGLHEVLRKSTLVPNLQKVLMDYPDGFIVGLIRGVDGRGERAGAAALQAGVDVLTERGSSETLSELLEEAVSISDKELGFRLLRAAPLRSVVDASKDPSPLDEHSAVSWCSEGIQALNTKLAQQAVGLQFHGLFLHEIVQAASERDVVQAAAAVTVSYNSYYTDKTGAAAAWEEIERHITSDEQALQILTNYKSIMPYTRVDGNAEIDCVTSKWGSRALSLSLGNVSAEIEKLKLEDSSGSGYTFNATYNDHTYAVTGLIDTMLAAGCSTADLHRAIAQVPGEVFEVCQRARTNIIFAACDRLNRLNSSGEQDTKQVREMHLRQALDVLSLELNHPSCSVRDVLSLVTSFKKIADTVVPMFEHENELYSFRDELHDAKRVIDARPFAYADEEAAETLRGLIDELCVVYPASQKRAANTEGLFSRMRRSRGDKT